MFHPVSQYVCICCTYVELLKILIMKASVKIILKKTMLNDGTFPVNLRITIDRKSKFYKTPYNTLPKFWNDKAGEFTSKFPNSLQCNRILNSIKQNASKILDTMIEEKHNFSLESFDSLFRPEEVKKTSFIAYFEERKLQLKESGK